MSANIAELIRQRDEIEAQIKRAADTDNIPVGVGLYRTRNDSTAKVYEVCQGRAIGAVWHGDMELLSVTGTWSAATGRFMREGEVSILDLVERIGDLP